MTTSFGRSGAKPFAPHTFGNRVETLGGNTPRVLLPRQVLSDMLCLVDSVTTEVGWVGAVERLGNDFKISEVFLVDQEVSGGTCELTPDGLAGLCQELLGRPDGMNLVNSLRFWGHSHHTMGTSPSGQDESQMHLFEQNGCNWAVRGIFNKDGRAEFALFLYNMSLRISDVSWELYDPADEERRTRWQREIAAKVREKRYTHTGPLGAGSGFSAESLYGGSQADDEEDDLPRRVVAPATAGKGKFPTQPKKKGGGRNAR